MTVLPASEELPFSVLLFCGGISGAFTSILLTPIELVKCKMQVPFIKSATARKPPTALSIMSDVYRHQGIAGFWHGQMGTLIRETGGSAAWFGSNEGVKLLFRKANKKEKMSDDDLALWQRLTAGAFAGMCYNFMFYPADTIKSRMQTEDVQKTINRGKESFWTAGKALWRAHGIKGLYRGCGITVARAAPSSAVIFTVHDALVKHFS
jgi:mitochondrial ornithine carrier protein